MREKRKIQVYDDEQQEIEETNITTNRGSQETKLREDKNSEREHQLVKPQQRDHSKRLKHLLFFLKGSTISFQPHNPH